MPAGPVPECSVLRAVARRAPPTMGCSVFSTFPSAGYGERVRRVFVPFGTNRSGAMSVVFALVILPLIIAVGTAVDYSITARTQEMLQDAADAAAVGAISMSSTAVGDVSAVLTQLFANVVSETHITH